MRCYADTAIRTPPSNSIARLMKADYDATFAGWREDIFAKAYDLDGDMADAQVLAGVAHYMPSWARIAAREGWLATGLPRLRCPSE